MPCNTYFDLCSGSYASVLFIIESILENIKYISYVFIYELLSSDVLECYCYIRVSSHDHHNNSD